jgi:PAS domain S-box-containing protein
LVNEECEIATNGRPAEVSSLLSRHAIFEAEQRAVQTALRESEERFRAVWEGTSEAMALSDRDGVVLTVNPAYCALYGLAPEQVVGQSFAVIFPDEERETAEAQYRTIFADPNPPPSYEARVQRPDGSRRVVEAHADFLVRDGERVVMISAIRDITERTQAERTQQDFIAMASHDLLTPITVLRARAQLLQRRQAYDEASVASILEQTTRMERMITDLRELVQVEGGQLTVRAAPVDLAHLARHAADRVRIQRTGHTVRIETPTEPIVGQWDQDRLGQVLDNLLSNAIKYSLKGGEIVVRVASANGEARLSVTDQGPGIPAAVVPHLFERFYRGEHHVGDAGLGLGLYISRMLVEAHGGRIWVTSAPGRGSTFTIALPLECR